MSQTTTTSVKLEPEMKVRVQKLAASKQRSTHWLMRQAIEQYVEREEAHARVVAEALDRWEEFRLTGMHVTGAEADAWLAQLERGEIAEPPKCHD